MLLVADIDRSLCVMGRSLIRKNKGRSIFMIGEAIALRAISAL
jgi:hypothetical protein